MLTSRQNPLVKSFRKLHQPKFRKQSQACLLEGTNLVEAAIETLYPIQVCCFTEAWRSQHTDLTQQLSVTDTRLELVSHEVLEAMTTTQHPDGVVAIIPGPTTNLLPNQIEGIGVVLESIQDPGNLGTILRSISAANSNSLFLSSDCVALTNPKVMRASVGAWFRVPTYVPADLPATLRAYQSQGVQIVATLATDAQPHWELNYQKPTLILIGNEGAGLSQELVALADQHVTIPIDQKAESLNAAIATSILLFEGCRQRAML